MMLPEDGAMLPPDDSPDDSPEAGGDVPKKGGHLRIVK